MSKQTINIGASPNDGTGTPLRTSFDYTNQNFTELYTALGGGVGLPGATTQVIFNDGGTNLAGDAGLVYNKTTDALTVAGLVTAGSASITGAATVGTTLGVTGDLTVDTSTLVVDSTNNRVGIGLASGMTAPLEVQSNTSGTSINVRGRSDNSGAMRFFANDGTTQQAYISADNTNIDILSVSTRPIRLSVNATVVASALNGGNVSIANGNLVMSTSGKGIDFSATADGSGTMTSELLNDYEEGTFTPNIGGTATYTTQTGRYTKIGNRVYFTITLEILLAGTGEDYRISGLPFTAAVNSSASIGYFGLLKSNQTFLSGQILGNQVYFAGTTVATASMTNAPGVIGNGTNLLMSGFFNV